MANYRFTKSDREGVVRRALVAAFADRDVALKAEENAIGMAAYEMLYPEAERKQAAAMPEHWLRMDSCLRITFSFRHTTLNLTNAVPVPNKGYGCQSIGTIRDEALNDRFTAMEHAKAKVREDHQIAQNNLAAMLDRFSSFNALAEAWPEGAEFYKHLTPKETVALPAVQIDAINAMLGLTALAA